LDFCWLYYSLLKLSIFIRRHLTKEFSFAPSYCSSLSTRSRSRSQIMLILQCCRCSLTSYFISQFCMLFCLLFFMVFKLFYSYAASYHDIWIFVGCIGLTIFEISPTIGFIRRHLTREFSFAPSFCCSQSRFQNVDFLFCRCFLITRHHALFTIFV